MCVFCYLERKDDFERLTNHLRELKGFDPTPKDIKQFLIETNEEPDFDKIDKTVDLMTNRRVIELADKLSDPVIVSGFVESLLKDLDKTLRIESSSPDHDKRIVLEPGLGDQSSSVISSDMFENICFMVQHLKDIGTANNPIGGTLFLRGDFVRDLKEYSLTLFALGFVEGQRKMQDDQWADDLKDVL